MKNPYEVLEIREGATEEEIKSAYKTLAKKYHPDRYVNNPLADLAEEKFKEVNEAYNYLIKNGASGSNRNQNSSQGQYNYSQNYSSTEFVKVRQLIQMRNFYEAENILNQMGNQTAEWHYLKGVIAINKNWFTQGYSHIQTAVNMDPNNMEYRNTLNQLKMNQNGYRTSSSRAGYNNNDAMCDLCGKLICADCLCECMGGDLISCC